MTSPRSIPTEHDHDYAAPVAYTHDLAFAESDVTKRYTYWRRGEHRREWSASSAAAQLTRQTTASVPPRLRSSRNEATHPPRATIGVVIGSARDVMITVNLLSMRR
jgi:hypothetical protein